MELYRTTWVYDDLFTGYEDPTLWESINVCKKLFAQLLEGLEKLDPADTDTLLHKLEILDRVMMSFSTADVYLMMRSMTEAPSPEASRVGQALQETKDLLYKVQAVLSEKLLAVPNAQTLADTIPALAPYRYLLKENARLSVHRPSSHDQELMRDMQANGGSGWYALRNALDGASPVTALRSKALSSDASVRKQAYEEELNALQEYALPMAACLNGIKGEALKELSYKHYDSVYEEMLDINKISDASLKAMFRAIERSLPGLRKFIRWKAEQLGHTNGLPWYELFAPLTENSRTYSYEEAHDLLVAAFSEFSEELGAFAEKAFNETWIDAEPRPGKQGGGITMDLPDLKECRILANFTGSLKDTRLIAHELGHAYHSRCLDHLPLLLRDAPTPICETASTMNEIIFLSKCIETCDKESLLALLDAHLTEELQTVMDIYSRFLFEDEVFSLRKERSLLSSDFCDIMQSAQKKVYEDSMDPAFLHPYMWMCKVHYYIPEFHYYNYPYTFGLLLSKGLYAQYKKDPEHFPAAYRTLLSNTCSGSMEEIAASAGIDITQEDFWMDSLQEIQREIDLFTELYELNRQ